MRRRVWVAAAGAWNPVHVGWRFGGLMITVVTSLLAPLLAVRMVGSSKAARMFLFGIVVVLFGLKRVHLTQVLNLCLILQLNQNMRESEKEHDRS